MYVSATSTRLSRGMSTPARRAIWLLQLMSEGVRQRRCPGLLPEVSIAEATSGAAVFSIQLWCAVPEPVEGSGTEVRLALALLVARVLTDDHHAAVATDDLALVADALDAGVDLHCFLFRRPRTARGAGRPLLSGDPYL